jgi:hypothetical protein
MGIRVHLVSCVCSVTYMPWRDAISLSFSRIDIVAHIPSESGVYGIHDGACCIFVGESWNLKARLLELAAALTDVSHLTITYELCDDSERVARKAALMAELIRDRPGEDFRVPELPGISFSMPADR